MQCVVNTRALSGDAFITRYLQDLFAAIAAAQPKLKVVLADAQPPSQLKVSANLQLATIPQTSHNPLFWKIWYNYKLPAFLRKQEADLLVNAEGIVSLRCKQPQWLIWNEPQVLSQPAAFTNSYGRMVRTNRKAYIEKADRILCFTESTRELIIKTDPAAASKTVVVPFMVSDQYKPADWDTTEAIRSTYTDGHAYFLYRGTEGASSHLVTVLKGFSVFKKRLKSSLQLVLIARSDSEKQVMAEQIRLYKYRQDIRLFSEKEISNLAALTAGAWASIQLSSRHSGIYPLLQSLACGVPVIAGETAAARELLQDAALYCDATAFEQVGQQLINIYKDEAVHKALSAQALRQSQQYQQAAVTATWIALLNGSI